MTSFRHRYGPWALVVGGSDGLGAAFADELAARGLDLVLVARRRAVLDDAADRIRRTHGVAVRAMATDAAAADAAVAIARSTADLDVGLVVCNAANAPAGAFVDLTPAELDGMLDLNCRLVAHLAHTFGRRLAERGRGGIVLLSSMAGLQGSARVAHYAATHPDVRAPGAPGRLAPPVMAPQPVVREALAGLGRRPVVIPGLLNRVAAFATQRLLPRRSAVALVSASTRAMYPPAPTESRRRAPPAAGDG